MQKSFKSDLPNSFKYRIYYEDTDLGGVVYYANYLKFFERARTDFLRSKNIIQTKLAEDSEIIFVVRSCQIEYLKPAKMDDLIEVFVKVKEIGKVSISMQQEIKLNDEILCKMDVTIVCVDSNNFKPKRIPETVLSIM